jgi:hypothetical protein
VKHAIPISEMGGRARSQERCEVRASNLLQNQEWNLNGLKERGRKEFIESILLRMTNIQLSRIIGN